MNERRGAACNASILQQESDANLTVLESPGTEVDSEQARREESNRGSNHIVRSENILTSEFTIEISNLEIQGSSPIRQERGAGHDVPQTIEKVNQIVKWLPVSETAGTNAGCSDNDIDECFEMILGPATPISEGAPTSFLPGPAMHCLQKPEENAA